MKKMVCDICGGELITIKWNRFPPGSDRYKVKIKHIADEVSVGQMRTEKLDMCESCMKNFVNWVNRSKGE